MNQRRHVMDDGNEQFLGSFDGYEAYGVLGEGAMGTVYRGVDVLSRDPVAIKVLNVAPGQSPDDAALMEKRFRREAKTTQALDHPNIVRVFHYGRTPQGRPFLAMELLEGVELRDALEATPVMVPGRVARLGRQIARALEAAHAKGVVHRDLKPENVFLTRGPGGQDHAKVVDFGIARLISAEHQDITKLTRAGTAIGTPRYMAPEQALARVPSPATDLYALGVMLYEMLSGDAPFDGENDMMTAVMHVSEPPPPLEVPGMATNELARWRELVHALLEKDPAARPADAATVAATLDVFAERYPEPAPLRLVAALQPAPQPHQATRAMAEATPSVLQPAPQPHQVTRAMASVVPLASVAPPSAPGHAPAHGRWVLIAGVVATGAATVALVLAAL